MLQLSFGSAMKTATHISYTHATLELNFGYRTAFHNTRASSAGKQGFNMNYFRLGNVHIPKLILRGGSFQ
jgi:hypothetical protein